jgi:hypothetical protein
VWPSARDGTKGLEGRGGRWRVIEHRSTSEYLWDLHWFGENLYLSTTRAVYTLDRDRLVLVDMGLDLPSTCYHLDAAEGLLWSIGPKDIMQFDGSARTRIL